MCFAGKGDRIRHKDNKEVVLGMEAWLSEDYDQGGMYNTAKAWEEMMRLKDGVRPKNVGTATKEQDGAAERDLQPGVIKLLGKKVVETTELATEKDGTTEGEVTEPDRQDEGETEDEQMAESDPEERKELDAWLEEVKGTPEEFWKMQADEVWLDREIPLDNYTPRLDMLLDGAKKILHEQMPGLSVEGLDERADLAVKLVLKDLAKEEADVLAGAKLDRRGNYKLAKGWQEKLLHGAYAQMRQQLLRVYDSEALKGKVAGDELSEDEALAWRTVAEPQEPGTLNMTFLYQKYPRREEEGADEYFRRLKNYTRQDMKRVEQLKADEEYEKTRLKPQPEVPKVEVVKPKDNLPVVEVEESDKKVVETERDGNDTADVEPEVEEETKKFGASELLNEELEGWRKMEARLEGEMEDLADDHPRKLELLRSFDNLKFAVLDFLANFGAAQQDIERARVLRRSGVEQDELGDMESDVAGAQSLSLEGLYSNGTLKRGASLGKNLKNLRRLEQQAKEAVVNSELRIDHIREEAQKAKEAEAAERRKRDYYTDLLTMVNEAKRKLKRGAKFERKEKKQRLQRQNGGGDVVSFPTIDAAEG